MANRNTLYANILVEELARSGLTAVCAAPGSRHTPLMLAFAQHNEVHVYSHLDERSASFFALGLALAQNAPVALVCTSGTAGANMFPAIIEATQSRVPLIVITADRPHELRHSGANQTIDQVKLFGDYPLWFVDMPLPEAQPAPVTLRYLRTTANRAYAIANGTRKGVVHLNVPFRKPLEPTPVAGDMTAVPDAAAARADDMPYAMQPVMEPRAFDANDISEIVSRLKRAERGVIICGGHAANHPQLIANAENAIASLARKLGFPVIAESYSLLRRYTTDTYHAIGGYDSFMAQAPAADAVIRLGDIPVSKALNQYLTRSQPQTVVHISEGGYWSDDAHLTTHVLATSALAGIDQLLRTMDDTSMQRPGTFWTTLYRMEQATWRVIDDELDNGAYFDGGVVYDVIDTLPEESTLFVGNSLPVRHLDQFGKPTNKRIYTYANRGASGIDGNLSTALGTGAARPELPLVAIVGDITFYHDMNGLLAIRRCGVPVTIVLLNNDGGGIFHRLPIRNHEPEFTDYFLTHHGLDFSHAAAMYGLDYIRADTRSAFRDAFTERVRQSQQNDVSTLIEVRTDAYQDDQRRQQIVAAVQKRIRELDLAT